MLKVESGQIFYEKQYEYKFRCLLNIFKAALDNVDFENTFHTSVQDFV